MENTALQVFKSVVPLSPENTNKIAFLYRTTYSPSSYNSSYSINTYHWTLENCFCFDCFRHNKSLDTQVEVEVFEHQNLHKPATLDGNNLRAECDERQDDFVIQLSTQAKLYTKFIYLHSLYD